MVETTLDYLKSIWDFLKTSAFWDFVKVLITAGAGFLGVWYGQRKLALKDARQAEREAQQAERERAVVASTVIEQLERFINGCHEVAHDDGTDCGQPAGGEYHRATTTPPTFDAHALKVNWNALPPDLIYDIFAIRSRQEGIHAHLSSEGFDDPPDYSEYFWTRRLFYAELGQQVTATAMRLRAAGGLPNEVLTKGDWSRDESFADVIERAKELQEKREASWKERQAEWDFLGAVRTPPETV